MIVKTTTPEMNDRYGRWSGCIGYGVLMLLAVLVAAVFVAPLAFMQFH